MHAVAFRGFFLAEMGHRFLTAYYGSVLEYARHVFLIAEAEGRIVGFVCGFLRPNEFYAHMSRQKRRFVVPALLGVIRRPWLLLRLVRRTRSVVTGRTRQQVPMPGVCELSSVAVVPSTGRKGVGRTLVERFIADTREAGADEIRLTTDAKGNDRVNEFYQSLGFELVTAIDQDGARKMNEYRMRLHPNE